MKNSSYLPEKEFHAEETVASLDPFLRNLADLCLKAADELAEQPFSPSLRRILDDLGILNHLFIAWSAAFPAKNLAFQTLKAELLSMVQDLEQFSGESGRSHQVAFLRGELPGFADELRVAGIPLLLQLCSDVRN